MRNCAELCGNILTFGFVRIYAVLCGNIEKMDYLGLECALGAENT
jgi:hypothetical protein